jgi:hypothetical protein
VIIPVRKGISPPEQPVESEMGIRTIKKNRNGFIFPSEKSFYFIWAHPALNPHSQRLSAGPGYPLQFLDPPKPASGVCGISASIPCAGILARSKTIGKTALLLV